MVDSLMKETGITVKKHGRLIAFDQCRQYWSYNGILYSIRPADGQCDFFGAESRLNAHFLRLFQITGKRFFSDDPGMLIMDPEYMKKEPSERLAKKVLRGEEFGSHSLVDELIHHSVFLGQTLLDLFGFFYCTCHG